MNSTSNLSSKSDAVRLAELEAENGQLGEETARLEERVTELEEELEGLRRKAREDEEKIDSAKKALGETLRDLDR